jgi:hypothetical protein
MQSKQAILISFLHQVITHCLFTLRFTISNKTRNVDFELSKIPQLL